MLLKMENYSIVVGPEKEVQMRLNANAGEIEVQDWYGYVYRTVNELNGKIYVGQHKGKFNSSYAGSGDLIVPALKKYGKENFSVKPISWAASRSYLDELEIALIAFYTKTFGKEMIYNISLGGESSLGCCQSSESRKKISDSRKGTKASPESRMKMSESHKGLKHSLAAKLKVSLSRLGKRHTEETKKKIGKRNLGKILSEETKTKIIESRIKNRSRMTNEVER